jgi:hypothetical protein
VARAALLVSLLAAALAGTCAWLAAQRPAPRPDAELAALDARLAALERVLGDRELAERMGAAAHIRYADWDTTPEELARHMRALVDATVAGTAR